MKNNYSCAFPCQQNECLDGTWNQTFEAGLTKYEWFAGLAMQAFLSNQGICAEVSKKCEQLNNPDLYLPIIRKMAYEMANEMLIDQKNKIINKKQLKK